MEGILTAEEKHADDLANLLFAVEPDTGGAPRHLYFSDEVSAQARSDKATRP
jgi:hypothetical protein